MFRFTLLAATVLAGATFATSAHAADSEARSRAAKIREQVAKVRDMRATLEITEKLGDEVTTPVRSQIIVSMEHGWRLEDAAETGHRVVNNLERSWEYVPKDKVVFVNQATTPELKTLFRRPIDQSNPLEMLDQESLKFLGEVKLDGQPVWRFEGTTETQVIVSAAAPLAKRKLSAWISPQDGLPRQIIETGDEGEAMTRYVDVKVNIGAKPEDFTFKAPAGVRTIDLMNRSAQPGTPAKP
jgi:outer membrane lipoprotein-sorting protein